MRPDFVGVYFAPASGWWWPAAQLAQRIEALSTTTLIRVLRTGVLGASRNPPALIDRLTEEFRRRLEAHEWLPASLTREEINRWMGTTAPSAEPR